MKSNNNFKSNIQDIYFHGISHKDNSPIFIHSLFRSGSTYLFNVFRRSSENYWCYQEPIHDWPLTVKNNPKDLLTFNEETNLLLRHPKLDKPYFYELYETYHFWCESLVKEIIYDDYFGTYAAEKTSRYLLSLIVGAKGRPVIQECRTSSRISEIRKRIGGVHIYLWRNPWDQWWSYKVTDYFDTVNQLIINAPSHPEVISRLREEICFTEFHSNNINQEFSCFNNRRLSAENSYFVFFTLWVLGLLEGRANADILLNIDTLSNSKHYCKNIIKHFFEFNIKGIDLSDCRIPQSIYGEADVRFFKKIEERVFNLLLLSGYSHSQLEAINKLRKEYKPVLWEESLEQMTVPIALTEISKLRELVKRIETREARCVHDYAAQLGLNIEENLKLKNKLMEQERELKEEKVRLSQKEQSLAEALAKVMENSQEIKRLEQALVALEREKTELLSRQEHTIQQYENELNSAKKKIGELNGQAHHWWTVADSLNKELQGVYASWSWRLTYPLRQLNLYRRKFCAGVKAVLVSMLRLPRRLARRILEVGLMYVRRHPAQKARLKALLARWPRLQARLYAFAAARHASAQTDVFMPPASAPAGSIDLSSYPVSVRTIYRQLLACRSQSCQKEESA